MHVLISLDGSDWEFKGFVGESWRGAQDPDRHDTREWKSGTVPGTVYQDLSVHGEIPDPYYERNSLYTEWVPARYWAYRKWFQVPSELRGSRVLLGFEGIDYAGRVFLNGVELGSHEGMFVPARYEVDHLLRYGEVNFLVVVLDPAPVEQPQVGRTSLVRTHKSRMTYWWDFCPRMIHVGIWDSVWLQTTGPVRMEDVHVETELSGADVSALARVHLDLSCRNSGEVSISAELSRRGQVIESYEDVFSAHEGSNSVTLPFHVANPELWWPNGSGDPNCYEVTVRIDCDEQLSDTRKFRFGIRKIELAPNVGASPDALPYTFVVNGVPTYIKGWNWVPLDVMYGLSQSEKLRHLLTLAKKANVNLLRVWGGGLIERDEFYNLCDEFGIMVWQEWIQSSSGIENKPSESPEFIHMMASQAECIIPKRRNHPSLVLWCGGNELQDLDGTPLSDAEPVLLALRKVVERMHPGALWLPTSPTGPLFMNSLANIEQNPSGLHDVHGPWEHQGLTEQYQLYNEGTSLFHSEFGVEGLANMRTIHETISTDMQWPATRDNPVWNHRGSWWINEPFVQSCFGGQIRHIDTLVQASQFLQAEGLRYAVESNRRRAFHNSGTIPWQFNESYPNGYCTASVDYYGRPKPAYYAVAKAYQPVSVSAVFETQAWQSYEEFRCDIFAASSLSEPVEGMVRADVIGTTGTVYHSAIQSLSIDANGVVSSLHISLPLDGVKDDAFFLDLHLQTSAGAIARNRYVFSRTADLACLLELPRTTLEVAMESDDGFTTMTVRNLGDVAALCVRFDDTFSLRTTEYIYFSDNGFHLLPGESSEVQIHGSHEASTAHIRVAAWNTKMHEVRCPSLWVGR